METVFMVISLSIGLGTQVWRGVARFVQERDWNQRPGRGELPGKESLHVPPLGKTGGTNPAVMRKTRAMVVTSVKIALSPAARPQSAGHIRQDTAIGRYQEDQSAI
jgi:hypothetical protein